MFSWYHPIDFNCHPLLAPSSLEQESRLDLVQLVQDLDTKGAAYQPNRYSKMFYNVQHPETADNRHKACGDILSTHNHELALARTSRCSTNVFVHHNCFVFCTVLHMYVCLLTVNKATVFLHPLLLQPPPEAHLCTSFAERAHKHPHDPPVGQHSLIYLPLKTSPCLQCHTPRPRTQLHSRTQQNETCKGINNTHSSKAPTYISSMAL